MTSVLEHHMPPFLSAAESRCPISASHSKRKGKIFKRKNPAALGQNILVFTVMHNKEDYSK